MPEPTNQYIPVAPAPTKLPDQPIKFDPSLGTPEQQAAQIQAQGEPTVALNEPSLHQRVFSTLMAPIKWWSKNVTQPTSEIGTQWFRQLFQGEAQGNPDWQKFSDSWNSGMSEGGIFKAWQNLSDTASLNREKRDDYFWGEKFFGEALSDPLNAIGWGLFGQSVKGVTKLGVLGSKGGFLGETLGNAEALYLRAVSAPFNAIKYEITKGLPFSHLQQAAKAQAETSYAVRTALGADYQADTVGGVAEWYSRLRARVEGGQALAEEDATLLGKVDNYLNLGTSLTLKDAVAPGGYYDQFFTAMAKDTPREFATHFAEMSKDETLKGLREKLTSRWAGEAPEGVKFGQTWDSADFIRKLMVAGSEQTNLLNMSQTFRSVQRWFLKAPAVAMLSYSLYAPQNAIEQVFRTLMGKIKLGYDPDGERAKLLLPLLSPDLSRGLETEASSLTKRVDLVPGPLGKIITASNDLTTPMFRSAVVNDFMPKAVQAMADNSAYGNVRDAISRLDSLDVPQVLKDTLNHGTLGNAFYSGDDYLKVMQPLVGNAAVQEAHLTPLVDGHLHPDVSPQTKQYILKQVKNLSGMPTAAHEAEFARVGREASDLLLNEEARKPVYINGALDTWAALSKNSPIRNAADAQLHISLLDSIKKEVQGAAESNYRANLKRFTDEGLAQGRDWKEIQRLQAQYKKDFDTVLEHANSVAGELKAGIQTKLSGMTEIPEAQRALDATSNSWESFYSHALEVRKIQDEHLATKSMAEDLGVFWRQYYQKTLDNFVGKMGTADAAERVTGAALNDLNRIAGAQNPDLAAAALAAHKDLASLSRAAVQGTDSWSQKDASLTDLLQQMHFKLAAIGSKWGDNWANEVQGWTQTIAKALDAIPVASRDALKQAHIEAMKATEEKIKQTFTDYTGTRLVDEAATNIVPFWTYSTRALEWMARMGFQRPALGINFFPYGRYWEETDNGYLPNSLPFGLQLNPARTMGMFSKLRQMQLPDYPAAHSGLAGGVEDLQKSLQNAGLFGTPLIGLAKSTFTSLGDIATGKPTLPEWGEALPPFLTSALNLAYGLGYAKIPGEAPLPQPVIEAMNGIKEAGANAAFVDFAHDIFGRSPYSEMFVRRYAFDQFHKAWSDLTPAEKVAAESGGSFVSVITDQLGAARYKPQSLIDVRNRITEFIAKESGKTVQEIEDAAKSGIPSYQIAPLDREAYKKMRALDGWKALTEMTLPLKDNEMRLLSTVQTEFYKQRGDLIDAALVKQEQLDNAFNNSIISPAAWRKITAENWDMKDKMDGVEKGLNVLSPLLRTPEEKALWRQTKGLPPTDPRMFDKLVDLYFSIQAEPDRFGNPDIGNMVRARDDLVASLSKELQDKFASYLARETQTDLMKEYYDGNKKLMSPYWDWETYLPKFYEDRGDHQSADYYRGIISRVQQLEVERVKALKNATSPEQLRALDTVYTQAPDVKVFDILRQMYRQQLLRSNPEIFAFKQKYFPDETL